MMPSRSGGEGDGDTHVPDTRTVHQRIADAYRDIAAASFDKSERVQGGYNYIPIAQMLAIIRAAHSKHGIITVFGPVQYDADQGEKRITVKKTVGGGAYEKTYQVANGHVDVTIFGANGDCIVTTVSCEAQDNSDKLTNLLLTNAQRTLYRTLYAIDEGPGFDPEEFNFSVEEKKELTAEKMEAEQKAKGSWRDHPINDPFFGSAKKAMGEDAAFVDAKAIEEAQRHAEAQVDIKHARATIARVFNESPGTLDRYIQIEKGKLPAQWDDDMVRKAYVDLMQEGGE